MDETQLRDHAVLIGHGRVGAPLADELALHGIPFVIVEHNRDMAESLRERGLPVIFGDATRPEVLGQAHVERARLVVVAAPDAYHARAILALARGLNPNVEVVVRTHSVPHDMEAVAQRALGVGPASDKAEMPIPKREGGAAG